MLNTWLYNPDDSDFEDFFEKIKCELLEDLEHNGNELIDFMTLETEEQYHEKVKDVIKGNLSPSEMIDWLDANLDHSMLLNYIEDLYNDCGI